MGSENESTDVKSHEPVSSDALSREVLSPATKSATFLSPDLAHAGNIRDSFTSNISYNPSEVGKAVPVSVVCRDPTQTYVVLELLEKPVALESESVSSGLVQLGRLDTITSGIMAIPPDMTMSTAVHSEISPLLRRKFVSGVPAVDVLPANDAALSARTPVCSPNRSPESAKSKRTTKRTSLLLTDNLERLMESANMLKKDSGVATEVVLGPVPTALPPMAPRKSQENTVSSDAFVTAEDEPASLSSTNASAGSPLRLPKRPNAASLGKARQASLEYATKHAHVSPASIVPGMHTGTRFHAEDEHWPQETKIAADERPLPRTPVSTGLISPLPLRGTTKNTDPAHDDPAPQLITPQTPPHGAPDVLESRAPCSTSTPQGNEFRPHRADHVVHSSGKADVDDCFSDVDEEEVVSKPLRGRSVRESTKNPRRKAPRRRKSRKSDSGRLRPFSYSTLVNLLESINGTVIGEEFDSLNLPTQEKHLIEKIIDLLSRLTSDMVIDESRYAEGIGRLEKALRLLEGFM